MFIYDRKLQYPVKIKNPSAENAKVIISQLGGPDGDLAALYRERYEKYKRIYPIVKGLYKELKQ